MIRLRPLLLTFVLAAWLPLVPGKAVAVPVSFDRDLALDLRLPERPVPAAAIPPDPRPILHIRLLTREIALLPSGRIVVRMLAAPPWRPPLPGRPAPDPVVLPLPGAMPLFLGALAGLALVGRRRRPAGELAGAGGTS
jgi:hypothetical protein